MSRKGNKVINSFIKKELIKHIGYDSGDLYGIYHKRYSVYSERLGKYIPRYNLLLEGWFTQRKYIDKRTRKEVEMYYITPFGQQQVIEDLKQNYRTVEWGMGIGQI